MVEDVDVTDEDVEFVELVQDVLSIVDVEMVEKRMPYWSNPKVLSCETDGCTSCALSSSASVYSRC